MSDDVNPYNAGSPAPAALPSAPATGRDYPLEVGFELQEEDEVAALLSGDAYRRALRQRRRTGNILMAIGIAIGGAALIAGTADLVPQAFLMAAFPAALPACLAFGLGAWSRFGAVAEARRQIAAAVKSAYADPRQRKLGGWIQISLGPAGIRQSAEHFESLWRWTAVDRIEGIEELLLFHLGAVQVLIVPKRAFQDQAHLQAYLDAARRFHRRALGDDSETPFYQTR